MNKLILMLFLSSVLNAVASHDIYFVTSNAFKYERVRTYIPQIKQLSLDLVEIQESDSFKVIEAKIKEALRLVYSPEYTGEKIPAGSYILVEDFSASLAALNGFPGPLIKWLSQSIKDEGLYAIAHALDNYDVEVISYMAYGCAIDDIHYVKASVKGTLLEPSEKGRTDLGSVFAPMGSTIVCALMLPEDEIEFDPLTIAAKKLRDYIELESVCANFPFLR